MHRATDRESSRPTVSVVIPAYNAAAFIERAIQSALDQTHEVVEVIVVDDASTDSTTQVVEGIAKGEQRVKLLKLSVNGGPAKARNAGFAAATGEWIAVLDADDAYLPDRLTHLMSRSADADILADNLLSYDPVSDVASPFPGPAQYSWEQIDLLMFADARRKHQDFGLFQPIFRRRFLEQHKLRYPEDVRHGEDFLFVFEAIARRARYLFSWRPGYLYTSRSSGWSRTLVDYQAMGVHVDALSKRLNLDLSPAVREKLAERAALIEELRVRELVRNAHQERRLFRALMLVAGHPVIWSSVLRRTMRPILDWRDRGIGFDNSADYWEGRYRSGGNSGAGSYNRLAQFKADFLNDFVARNGIRSIVEFGSGDGLQLKLADFPTYVGIDVSRAAIAATSRLFADDPTKRFLHISEVPRELNAELSLSLDVIYHLVEAAAFATYMRDLFKAASRFVIIYSSNVDEPGLIPHVRHRRFTDWVHHALPEFELSERVPNPFPFDAKDPDNTSLADFYIYVRKPVG